ncbi:MAG TPA: hypothetical protein VHW45_04510 [Candidatus Sulfotelmatobacter sp.]|nr:hypothetical protein [Candidatus Sulfotelmatobacter sp.]
MRPGSDNFGKHRDPGLVFNTILRRRADNSSSFSQGRVHPRLTRLLPSRGNQHQLREWNCRHAHLQSALVPGSPFLDIPNNISSNPVADWLTRYFWVGGNEQASSSQNPILTSSISSANGSLGAALTTNTGPQFFPTLLEDHSGEFLYSGGQDDGQCTSEGVCDTSFASWKIAGDGAPILLSGPSVMSFINDRNGFVPMALSR